MPDRVGRCSHHEGKRLEAGYPQILSSSSALSDATSLLWDALLSSADMQNVKFAKKITRDKRVTVMIFAAFHQSEFTKRPPIADQMVSI